MRGYARIAIITLLGALLVNALFIREAVSQWPVLVFIGFLLSNFLDAHSTYLCASLKSAEISEINVVLRWSFGKFGVIRGLLIVKGPGTLLAVLVPVWFPELSRAILTITLIFLYFAADNYRLYLNCRKGLA